MNTIHLSEAVAASDQSPTGRVEHVCLASAVKAAVEAYFTDLNGHAPGKLHEMVMTEVERPLLETVMRHVRGNQSRAAKMLGINRSTLRKKLAQYGLNS